MSQDLSPEPAELVRVDCRTIREWFCYDPETGIIRRLKQAKKANKASAIGTVAGFSSHGYRMATLMGTPVRVHHIAFVVMTGSYPKGDVDHINGNGLDNRWANLRDVPHKTNGRNQKINKRNTSGTMGVDRQFGKWRARIIVDQLEIHLGMYERLEDAVAARKSAEEKHGFHKNHGRLSNVN